MFFLGLAGSSKSNVFDFIKNGGRNSPPFFQLFLFLVIHTASRLCVDGYLENIVFRTLSYDGSLDGNPQDVRLSRGLDAGVGGEFLDGIDVLGEPRDMTFARFDIFDTPALFTELRPSDIVGVPDLDKLHRYDLRHGDDDSFPVTLEHRVVVNRFGTIFTAVPLLDEHVRSRSITDDDWGFCSDLADCTPTEFLAELEKENANV